MEPLERFHLPESLYLSAFETPLVECGTFSRFLSSAAQYRSSPACLSLIGLALIARTSRAYFSRPTRILLMTYENSSDAPNWQPEATGLPVRLLRTWDNDLTVLTIIFGGVRKWIIRNRPNRPQILLETTRIFWSELYY